MHVYACLVHVQAWVCMLAMVMEHAPKPMVFGIDSLIFNCCLFKQRWPLLGTVPLAPPRLPLHLIVCRKERRWLRSKHFWEEMDIDWASLEQKLLVRQPTRLTREELWQQLFCRRQQGQRWLERAYEGNNRHGTSGYPCNH